MDRWRHLLCSDDLVSDDLVRSDDQAVGRETQNCARLEVVIGLWP